MNRVFEKALTLPCSAQDAFAWHEQPDALKKLIPPDGSARVLEHQPGLQGSIGDGARVVMLVGRWPLRMRWVAVHEGYIAGRQFVDVQQRGPFAYWRHTHSFRDIGPHACELRDQVDYRLPLGAIGDLVAHAVVRRKIEEMFAWRHEVTARELSR